MSGYETSAHTYFNGPEWEELKDWLNYGAPADGWPPASLLVIGTSILLTNGTHNSREAAREFYRDMVAEANRRWEGGFYPDPFTREPVIRAVANG